jgi:hypothetical protein
MMMMMIMTMMMRRMRRMRMKNLCVRVGCGYGCDGVQ